MRPAPLLTEPLCTLTDDELSDYHYGVFNTIVEDSVAYFFPRLIELTHNDMSSLNTELVYQSAAWGEAAGTVLSQVQFPHELAA